MEQHRAEPAGGDLGAKALGDLVLRWAEMRTDAARREFRIGRIRRDLDGEQRACLHQPANDGRAYLRFPCEIAGADAVRLGRYRRQYALALRRHACGFRGARAKHCPHPRLLPEIGHAGRQPQHQPGRSHRVLGRHGKKAAHRLLHGRNIEPLARRFQLGFRQRPVTLIPHNAGHAPAAELDFDEVAGFERRAFRDRVIEHRQGHWQQHANAARRRARMLSRHARIGAGMGLASPLDSQPKGKDGAPRLAPPHLASSEQRMKFFIDTAEIAEIRDLAATGMVDGVTTNPSLIMKSGRDFTEITREICEIVDGPVSAEVTAVEADEMIAEGRALAKIAPNIAVKVPLTWAGLRACRVLADDGHMVNVTLCFSANQALLAAKAGASFISPFIGRLDDIGLDGMELIADIRQIYDNYDFTTRILAASIRTVNHVAEAAKIGADVATLPPSVLRKLAEHPLTDKGLADFLSDWATTGQKILG